MKRGAYQFREMASGDLPQVKTWLAHPHVIEWWGGTDQQFALVQDDLANPAMRQFIVEFDCTPFAYVQNYDLDEWPDAVFRTLPPGTHAIDQFIGEPDMVDHGHGSAFIRALVDQLLADGAPCVITDPDVENARAIRCYEKAGFSKRSVVNTLEGPALLMVRTP